MRPAQVERRPTAAAARSPAPRPARPGRSAAPAGPPSRGSPRRRRRGRAGTARAPAVFARAGPRLVACQTPRSSSSPSTTPTSSSTSSGRYAPRLRPAHRRSLRRGRDHRPGDPRRAAATVALFVSRLPAARRPHMLRGVPPLAHGRADRAPRDRRALGPLPRRRRRPAARPGQGQVRRLPADAARPPRRGVPHAITELLSDWGSTVADRRSVSVKIISPTHDPLTLAHPRLPRPDGHAEPASTTPRLRRRALIVADPRDGRAAATRSSRSPDRAADPGHRRCATSRSRSTARPDGLRRRRGRRPRASSAPARPGWPPRCTPPPRASRRSCSRPRRSAARPAPAR